MVYGSYPKDFFIPSRLQAHEDGELLTWAERAKNRKKILLYLLQEEEPRKPSEIASDQEIHRNNVSRALREMRDNENRPDLVECINPDAPHSRRYVLTDKGRMIAEKLKDLK